MVVESQCLSIFGEGMKDIQQCSFWWSAASSAIASGEPHPQTVVYSGSAPAARSIRRPAPRTFLNHLTTTGETAGVGPDGTIIVIPRECVPRGVGQVKVLKSRPRSSLQRRAIFKQSFLLSIWSQCRVAVVLAFSFAVPFLLIDYTGAPPLSPRLIGAVVPARGLLDGGPVLNRTTHRHSAAAAETDGGWLGWSIWGACRRPQTIFDPGSDDTIDSFGAYNRTAKAARAKTELVSCVTDAFGTHCSRDLAYATDAEHRAANATQEFAQALVEG